MAENLQVNMRFTADTQQAISSIQSLQNKLTSLGSINVFGNKNGLNTLNNDLVKAQNAAVGLSSHLKNAFNVDTGKLDLNKLQLSLNQCGNSLSQYGVQLSQFGTKGTVAFGQISRAIANTNTQVIGFGDKIKGAFEALASAAKWTAAYGAVRQIVSGFSSAVSYAKDLNESLNNIRIVTGESAEQMAKFAQQANKMAKDLSVSTTTYTDAALTFYRQGLNDQQAQARADVAVKMANVTWGSASDIADQLTAIWNNFDDGSKSLEYYADVMTALGASTATSTDEIANGMQKFAAVADTVGLSYEYAAAALATVTANTRQSADVVGTAFKTLFSRMEELEQGKTLDDGTTLGQYSQALLNVGVNIKDTSGQLKDMDTILDETAAAWGRLSTDQQVALAQSVAGVRQYQQFIALMSNWSDMEKNLETSYNSTGTLNKQADIYAESWEAASKRVKAAMEGLYDSLIDDQLFINLTDGLADLISVVNKLVDSVGGLGGVLSIALGLVTKLAGAQIAQGFRNIGMASRDVAKSFDQAVFHNPIAQKLFGASPNSKIQGTKEWKAQETNKRISELESRHTAAGDLQADTLRFNRDMQNKIDGRKVPLTPYQQAQIDQEIASYNEYMDALSEEAGEQEEKKAINEKIREKRKTDLQQKHDAEDIAAKAAIDAENTQAQQDVQAKKIAINNKLAKEETEQNQKIRDDYKKSHGIPDGQNLTGDQVKELNVTLQELTNTINNKRQEEQDKVNEEEKERQKEQKDKEDARKEKQQKETDVLNERNQAEEDLEKEDDIKIEEKKKAGEERKQEIDASVSGMEEISDLGNTLTSAAEAAASLTAGVLTAVNSIRILGDESASTGDKVTAIISLVTIAIPSIVSGISAAADILIAKGIEVQAAWWWVTAIVAVIAAVVLVATDAFNWFESDAEKMERLAEETENAKTAAEDAKNAYEDLLSGIATHNELLDKLQSLTAGTLEFRQALLEANNAARDLIEQYGLTSDDYYYDKNGAIRFYDSSIEKLQERQIKAAEDAQDSADVADFLEKNNLADKAVKGLTEQSGSLPALFEQVNRILEGTGQTIEQYMAENPEETITTELNNLAESVGGQFTGAELYNAYAEQGAIGIGQLFGSGSGYQNILQNIMDDSNTTADEDAQQLAINSMLATYSPEQFAAIEEEASKSSSGKKLDKLSLEELQLEYKNALGEDAYKALTSEEGYSDLTDEEKKSKMSNAIKEQKAYQMLTDQFDTKAIAFAEKTSKKYKDFEKMSGSDLDDLINEGFKEANGDENSIEYQAALAAKNAYESASKGMYREFVASGRIKKLEDGQDISIDNLSIEDMEAITNYSKLVRDTFGDEAARGIQDGLLKSGANGQYAKLLDELDFSSSLSAIFDLEKLMGDSGGKYSSKVMQELHDTLMDSIGGEAGLLKELYGAEDFQDTLEDLQDTFKETGSISTDAILDAADSCEILNDYLNDGERSATALAEAIEMVAESGEGINSISDALLNAIAAASKTQDFVNSAIHDAQDIEISDSVTEIASNWKKYTDQIQDSVAAGFFNDPALLESISALFGDEMVQVLERKSAEWEENKYSADRKRQEFYSDPELINIGKYVTALSEGDFSGIYQTLTDEQKSKLGITVDSNGAVFGVEKEENGYNSAEDFSQALQDFADIPEKLADAMAAEMYAASGAVAQKWNTTDAEEGWEILKQEATEAGYINPEDVKSFWERYGDYLNLDGVENAEQALQYFIKAVNDASGGLLKLVPKLDQDFVTENADDMTWGKVYQEQVEENAQSMLDAGLIEAEYNEIGSLLGYKITETGAAAGYGDAGSNYNPLENLPANAATFMYDTLGISTREGEKGGFELNDALDKLTDYFGGNAVAASSFLQSLYDENGYAIGGTVLDDYGHEISASLGDVNDFTGQEIQTIEELQSYLQSKLDAANTEQEAAIFANAFDALFAAYFGDGESKLQTKETTEETEEEEEPQPTSTDAEDVAKGNASLADETTPDVNASETVSDTNTPTSSEPTVETEKKPGVLKRWWDWFLHGEDPIEELDSDSNKNKDTEEHSKKDKKETPKQSEENKTENKDNDNCCNEVCDVLNDAVSILETISDALAAIQDAVVEPEVEESEEIESETASETATLPQNQTIVDPAELGNLQQLVDLTQQMADLLQQCLEKFQQMTVGSGGLITSLAQVVIILQDIVQAAARAAYALQLLGGGGGSGDGWDDFLEYGESQTNGQNQYLDALQHGHTEAAARAEALSQAQGLGFDAVNESRAARGESTFENMAEMFQDTQAVEEWTNATEAANQALVDGREVSEAYQEAQQAIADTDEETKQAEEDKKSATEDATDATEDSVDSTEEATEAGEDYNSTQESNIETLEDVTDAQNDSTEATEEGSEALGDTPAQESAEPITIDTEVSDVEMPEIEDQTMNVTVNYEPKPDAISAEYAELEGGLMVTVEYSPTPAEVSAMYTGLTGSLVVEVTYDDPGPPGHQYTGQNNPMPPGFAIGKNNSNAAYEGIAQVGEHGPELMVTNHGLALAGVNGPTYTYVNKDDIIYTHEQTRQILQNNNLGPIPGFSIGKNNDIPGFAYGKNSSKGGKGGSEGMFFWEDEWERYHYLDQQLEDLENAYDSLDEAKDRAFGKNKLKFIEEETKNLEKQAELIKQKQEEQKQYYADWKADAQSTWGGMIQFDENGLLANYDELQRQYLAEKEVLETSSSKDQAASDLLEHKWKLLETYEEILNEGEEFAADYAEVMNQIIDARIEGIQTKIEIKTEVDDEELEYLEYLYDRIEDDGKQATLALAYTEQMMNKNVEKLQSYMDAIKETVGDDQLQNFLNGDFSGLTDSQLTELFEELGPEITSILEDIDDLGEQLVDIADTAFESFNEDLENSNDVLDSYNSSLETFKDLAETIGEDTLGITQRALKSMSRLIVENSKSQLLANKTALQLAKDKVKQYQELYDAETNDVLKAKWKEALQEATEDLADANKEVASSMQATYEAMISDFQYTVSLATKNAAAMVSGTFGDLDTLSEAYNREKDLRDLYLEDYAKYYELSKLTREIESSIDDTDNLKGKKELKKLLEQINELREAGVEVSQYDVDYLEKAYELELARQSLEEAKDAKSLVRLSRDANGNWGYVYTANEEDVEKAEQEYEDKLYEMQKANAEYIDELSDTIQSIEKEMFNALSALDPSSTGYEAERQSILDYYTQQIEYFGKEINKVLDNQANTYEDSVKTYEQANFDLTDSFNETILSMLTGKTTAAEYIQTLLDGLSEVSDAIADAETQYSFDVSSIADGTVSEMITDIGNRSTETGDKINSTILEIDENLQEIQEQIEITNDYLHEQLGSRTEEALELVRLINRAARASSFSSDEEILGGTVQTQQFDTGGYTGSWGSMGKLAVLHEKELVLNKNDTDNLLSALDVLKTIQLNAGVMSMGLGNLKASSYTAEPEELQQTVTITAEFPNVSEHSEIEEAFNNLINQASQYANRKSI